MNWIIKIKEKVSNFIAGKFWGWFLKTRKGKELSADMARLKSEVNQAVGVIRERTEISVDHAMTHRGMCYVFVSGRYKGGDYVQLYSLRVDDFKELIEILRQMQKHATLKRVDRDPMRYSGFIKRELEK